MNIKKYAPGFSALLFALLINIAHADTAPDAMVKNAANEVLEIIKIDKDIENGNMDKLGKLVEDKIATKFDFDRMSKLVLGRSWITASQNQKDQFMVEFRSLLIRTYASALSKYKNQTIVYKPQREDLGSADVKVKTQIIQPGGQDIALDYSLEKFENDWKVYDVTIEGLSLVVTYRGQFSEEVKKNGLDGLIQKLTEKNKRSPQPVNPA